MVDVSGKEVTRRRAEAMARVVFPGTCRDRALAGEAGKGSMLGTARIAGIQAAKRTSELIPLCHPLPIHQVEVAFELEGEGVVRVACSVTTVARTGVEMEALVGASVAALTLYDMAKALDKGIRIEEVRLVSKSGGKSGDYQA